MNTFAYIHIFIHSFHSSILSRFLSPTYIQHTYIYIYINTYIHAISLALPHSHSLTHIYVQREPRGRHERQHHLFSAILLLGEIALAMPSQPRIIFLLSRESNSVTLPLVMHVLNRIASSRGFTQLEDFMKSMLPYLLSEWHRTYIPKKPENTTYIHDFPIRLISRAFQCGSDCPKVSIGMSKRISTRMFI